MVMIVDAIKSSHSQGLRTPSKETQDAVRILYASDPERMKILMNWLEGSLLATKNALMIEEKTDGTVQRLQGQAVTLTEIIRILSKKI